MEKVLEIAGLVVMLANKATVVGIALWAVWALQTLLTDPKWLKAYPSLGRFWMRAGVAMVAAGFAMDAMTAYVPAVSEVVINAGALIVMHLFRRQYYRGHGLLEILKRKQKSEI